MNIVIEGADCTGKSTLARFLAPRLGLTIQESEGPPQSTEEFHDRLKRYSLMSNTIFVRHPCVSQMIYGEVRRQATGHTEETPFAALKSFYRSCPLFIYCSPPGAQLKLPHILKAYDTPEHVAILNERHALILSMYQEWACDFAHLMYRIGDDRGQLLRRIRPFDPVQDVEDFHHAMRIGYDGPPRALDFELTTFRLKFLREETLEYEEAAHAAAESTTPKETVVDSLADTLDSLVDLVYVALGTAHLHGFTKFREAWRRVHSANMLKLPGDTAVDYHSRVKMRVVKPPHWTAPDHRDLVT